MAGSNVRKDFNVKNEETKILKLAKDSKIKKR